MRNLILSLHLSLDGFAAGPAGATDWIFTGDQEAMAWKAARLADASLHIMGSRTFRDMAAYWPTANTIFAAPMNQIPKTVFSRNNPAILQEIPPPSEGATLQPGAETWRQASIATGPLAAEIAKLKAQDGKPIIAHGGAIFARSLVAENLIDRYLLMIHPIILGAGSPVFSDVTPPRRLHLVSTQTFPKGTLAQTYRPA